MAYAYQGTNRSRRVEVFAVAAFQKFERYQCIEEVACRPRMKPQASLQRFKIFGVFGQFRE